MSARIHPGAPILVMDHSVITLHDGGRADGAETALLSLYDIHFSALFEAGHVALLRVPSAGVDGVFTDRLELGRKWQKRLLGIGTDFAMLRREPVVVTDFRRDPWVGGSFGYRFRAVGLDVSARWDNLDAPFFAEGPNGGFSPAEDIWSFFVGARTASITVNGAAAPGAPFDDDAWRNRLGRSVSSAHSALGETRITPDAARQPG